MDNPRVLKQKISEKLDELDKINFTDLSYDGFENPARLLKHHKEELRFFNKGKHYLARIIDKPKNKKEQEDYEELREFYLTKYPGLELNLLRVINILENKLDKNK